MRTKTCLRRSALALFLVLGVARGAEGPASRTPGPEELKRLIEAQQKQIEQLQQVLQEQKAQIDRILAAEANPAPAAQASSVPAPQPAAQASSAPAPQPAPAAMGVVNAPDLFTRMDSSIKNLAGFRFSGDFRFRLDSQLRSGNEFAAPLQNIRGRYRFRMNIDKELDRRFSVHAQLSTGPLSNANTNDQDFGGITAKAPFSLAEAYIAFNPNSNVQLRGGRMEEVFADNMRFLWDDDVRFNGFQQKVKVPVRSHWMGLSSIEFRAGEYILSNPNVAILTSSSPFVSAGFAVGQKVRDSNLFHPGMVVEGSLGSGFHYQFVGDIELYRNPDQIQLASLAAGYPVLVSNTIGLALSGPLSGTGNATTTAGGAIYSARNFQIARLSYRISSNNWLVHGKEMPAFVDFQASRNLGTGKHRDAWMVSANLGSVKKFGDMRLLYSFAVKDANALIAQFADDDLGTGSGVNIAVHGVRFDLGLTKFLTWQNLFFIQHERDRNNPAEMFFVPLQAGANATFRFLGQLAFTF
jgi:Putative porin